MNPSAVGGSHDPAAGIKSDFVSFATHQLRTPLSGVKWLLELAARDETVGEETRSYIADARDAAERLIRLVNEMLKVSRLENGRVTFAPQPVALGDVTRQVVAEMATVIAAQNLRAHMRGLDEAPSVTGDPALISQAITNLVSNAVRYSPAGASIDISLIHDASTVTWTVRDAGIGIPAAAQPHIFQKFYRGDNAVTVDTEGLGLGLCVARLIVERLGGRMWFESTEDRGSTFSFSLEIAR
jgi:signal transduction histidine kinase